MKKLFIGLLVAAAGTGVYFYFSKKQNSSSSNFKELILGKWKIDSFQLPKDDTISDLERTGIALNSSYKNYNYEFDTGGIVLKTLPDSVKIDTSFYRWIKNKELIWSQIKEDSITKPLQVVKLNKDDFILQSAGSGNVYLKKLK
jgi:hypothetical protein